MVEASVAVRKKDSYLLRRRTAGERWAGLWDFVRFELTPAESPSQIVDAVRDQTGMKIDLGPQIAELKHAVTRYRITLKCFTAQSISGTLHKHEEWEWVPVHRFGEFPLSVTGRKFAKLLAEHNG